MINSKIKAKIESFDGDFVVLSNEGNEIKWPRKNLNKNQKIGDTVYLVLYSEKEDEIMVEELARAVLNEVVKGE